MDKWTVEFMKVKDGATVQGSFWSCVVEDEGAALAVQKAVDKMIDTVPAEDGGYYRVFRATNTTLMSMKTTAKGT